MTTGLVLLAILASLYVARRPLLRAVGRFLVVAEADPQCDAIVLLNGNISTRPYRAADLYRKQKAPVLIARLADTEEVRLGVIPNVSDATRDLLVRLGVAGSDVEVVRSGRWVAGTLDEAIILRARIRERGFHRVVIVTDAFHTRRARWTFTRVTADPDVVYRCVATRFSTDLLPRWWRSEYGLLQVVNEYLKLVHYAGILLAGDRRFDESRLPDAERTRRYVTGRD